jgi:4-oxalocrotonate tautomerase
MPILNLKIAPLQTPDRHATLARALTRITAKYLGKRPEVTAVAIEQLPQAQWFIGGREIRRPTALLEISVTQGTNTAQEKEAFIEAAFAELQQQLAAGGALEEASYVIVREVPAGDWGYDGVTQAERRRVRELVGA